MDYQWPIPITTNCGNCCKEIYLTNSRAWIYKREEKNETVYFCSWSCLRAYDRMIEKKRKKRNRR